MNNYNFDTLCLHAGYKPDEEIGSRQVPIYQNASYIFKNSEKARNLFALKEFGYIYSRLTNPTVSVLQNRMAALEGGVGAVCASSGHAVQMLTFFNLLKSGDEFLASDKLYGGTINQFKNSFAQFGWKVKFTNFDDLQRVSALINSNTKAIFAESLANPGGNVSDIEALAEIAHKHAIPLIIDNTMATPYLCKPIDFGADLVVNSTTKFLSGNGSSLGGAVVDSGNFDWAQNNKFTLLTEADSSYHGLKFYETFGNLAFTVRGIAIGLRDLGACQSPMNAFLTLNGIETLSLRMKKHCENAQAVAEFLENHKKVEWVSYLGLKSNKYHKIASKYFKKGFGSVFTFALKDGYTACEEFIKKLNLFSHLANIGDSKSLIIHPASTTHAQLSEAEREKAGASSNVLRVSIGLENIEDIIKDIKTAL